MDSMLCAAMLILAHANPPGSVSERLKNDKVAVTEFTLKPGEAQRVEGRYPAITVYLDGGALEFTPYDGQPDPITVKSGDVVFSAARAGEIKNRGVSGIKFVRTEFLTNGDDATWGTAGLSPNYKLLIENRYTRTYDIKIPARGSEPQHTHRARVVICLSGAALRHTMPDGRVEPSTLETGEIAWRSGGTHIGQNLGNTNLWVIAVEPK